MLTLARRLTEPLGWETHTVPSPGPDEKVQPRGWLWAVLPLYSTLSLCGSERAVKGSPVFGQFCSAWTASAAKWASNSQTHRNLFLQANNPQTPGKNRTRLCNTAGFAPLHSCFRLSSPSSSDPWMLLLSVARVGNSGLFLFSLLSTLLGRDHGWHT